MSVDLGLRARRLERLRVVRSVVVAAPVRDRADALAAELGGSVLRHERGAVVVVDSARQLPLAAERLDSLPWPVDPGQPLICLDTETTGLGTGAGTLAFLVGIGIWDGDRFRVRQLLLPDQPDEPALLDAVAAAV